MAAEKNEFMFKARKIRRDGTDGEWIEGSLIILDWEADQVYIMPEQAYASTLTKAELILFSMEPINKKTICRLDENRERLREEELILHEEELINSLFDVIKINGELYLKKKLCLDWFTMTNDVFYKIYGFNFNPHEYPGLYEWGSQELRRIALK